MAALADTLGNKVLEDATWIIVMYTLLPDMHKGMPYHVQHQVCHQAQALAHEPHTIFPVNSQKVIQRVKADTYGHMPCVFASSQMYCESTDVKQQVAPACLGTTTAVPCAGDKLPAA